jgi:hypothetical protein
VSVQIDRYVDELLADIGIERTPLLELARDLSLAHSEHLKELGPIRVLALDPCPRCTGGVIAGETEARCAAGCGWSYRRHGGDA